MIVQFLNENIFRMYGSRFVHNRMENAPKSLMVAVFRIARMLISGRQKNEILQEWSNREDFVFSLSEWIAVPEYLHTMVK